MAKVSKRRGPRKLSPSTKQRLDRSLRLMADRCLVMPATYKIPPSVASAVREAHDALCRAFDRLGRD